MAAWGATRRAESSARARCSHLGPARLHLRRFRCFRCFRQRHVYDPHRLRAKNVRHRVQSPTTTETVL